jgi:hypothetical protein
MSRCTHRAYNGFQPQPSRYLEGCIDPLPAMPMTNNLTNMTAAALFPRIKNMPTKNASLPSLGRRLWMPAGALLLMAAAPAVYAEAGNPLKDTWNFSLGGFLLETDTTIRVDGELGTGTEFDAGRDLGLQDADRFRFDGYWRMTPRQKLRLMYFDTRADGTRTLDEEIEFGDEVYEINAELHGEIKTTVTALSYEFDFWQGENYELGGTFGIHNLKFEMGLEGTVNDTTGAVESSAEANGPLPVLGLHGIYRFNDKFYLDYGVQFFKISFDVYDGSVTDANISGVWQFSEHWGVGAGWNQFRTSLEVDGDRFDGELKWEYGGARIFVTASF